MPATNPLRCANSTMAQNGAGTGTVLLLDNGSYPGQGNYLNETVTWTSVSGNWTVVSPSQIDPAGPLPLRTDHGMSYDGATHVVLYGGKGQSETAGVLEDTWLWSGSSWVAQSPTVVPFGRYKHKMASLFGVGALMFGGTNNLNILQDTWVWQSASSNWVQLSLTTLPPARTDHAMASSTTATSVLLFGGKGTNSPLGDTWQFTGNVSTGAWAQQFPATSPPRMWGATMCYDPSTSKYILFGGSNDDNLISPPQTWVYSAGNWAQFIMPNGTGPAARVGAMMAYDSVGVLMFGGYGYGQNADSATWRYNSTTNVWTQL